MQALFDEASTFYIESKKLLTALVNNFLGAMALEASSQTSPAALSVVLTFLDIQIWYC